VGDQLDSIYKWQNHGIDGLLRIKKVLDMGHSKGVITQKTRELDDAFQRYTVSCLIEYEGHLSIHFRSL